MGEQTLKTLFIGKRLKNQFWHHERVFLTLSYIEMGPPPIKTDHGWLILYHGIDGRDDSRVYRLGAAVMDYADPSIVLWRCKKPILEPSELFEKWA